VNNECRHPKLAEARRAVLLHQARGELPQVALRVVGPVVTAPG